MKTLRLGLSLLVLCLLCALSFGQKLKTGAPGATPPKKGETVAVLYTNYGKIIFKFFPKVAPEHVKNFEKLAKAGFYDGMAFHRVIPGFMIQGGDPNSKEGATGPVGAGGPGYSIKAEFNDIPHTRGIVSMARTSDPDSAGSQFFICVADYPSLNHKYTVFGQVVQGMDIADKIVNLPTSGQNMPDLSQSRVKKVRITTWPVKG